MSKKVCVILSGCGVYDGSEIHEAVLTLLFLDRLKAEVTFAAPDMNQFHVINHQTGDEADETRNVMAESARIARGAVTNMKDVKADDFDAVIIPGGFGAAKNLSDFAVKGKDALVHPEVVRVLKEMTEAGKPVGAICIAPATLTKALGDKSPKVTIGNDAETASAVEAMGGVHENCPVSDIVYDEKNKIITTPAYMLGPGIADVADGIEKLVTKILEIA